MVATKKPFRISSYKIAIWALVLLASSCSYKVRFKKLVTRHPDLIRTIDLDTTIKGRVIERDTFIYQGITDSFYIADTIHDTTILKEKYRFDKQGEKFRLQVYPDTVYVPDTVYWENKIILPGKVLDFTPLWVYWIKRNWLTLALLTLSLTLILTLRKKKSGG